METVQDSTDGNTVRPFNTSPIPGFFPFSLLPDELIIAIATRLRPRTVSGGLREPQPASSLDCFASVDKRLRRIALAIRWEVRSCPRSGRFAPRRGTTCGSLAPAPQQRVTLHVDGELAALVLARLLRYGHHVKEFAVVAKSAWDKITSQEQLTRVNASLSACDNLLSFSMTGVQYRSVGDYGSLAVVMQTLAARASKLEYLRLDPYWTVLLGMDHLEEVLRAAVCLKGLEIECTGRQTCNLQACQFPPLPPLPVLTKLRIPTAELITMATFCGTDACKQLQLAHVRAGDLVQVAKCVGHSLERLDIWTLAETYHQNPLPVFAALRQLKLPHCAAPVCLSNLLDPATPLETLTIWQMSRENLADLQEFYERQPRKTLTFISILSSGVADWLDHGWAEMPGPEEPPELVNRRLGRLKANTVLKCCRVWANKHGIHISADW